MGKKYNRNSYTIWNGSNYVGTINYREYTQDFELILNGHFETYKFKNSKHLEKLLKKYCCSKITIPNEILDEIDRISIMNLL